MSPQNMIGLYQMLILLNKIIGPSKLSLKSTFSIFTRYRLFSIVIRFFHVKGKEDVKVLNVIYNYLYLALAHVFILKAGLHHL